MSIIEQFLQENVPRHMLNERTSFISWHGSAAREN